MIYWQLVLRALLHVTWLQISKAVRIPAKNDENAVLQCSNTQLILHSSSTAVFEYWHTNSSHLQCDCSVSIQQIITVVVWQYSTTTNHYQRQNSAGKPANDLCNRAYGIFWAMGHVSQHRQSRVCKQDSTLEIRITWSFEVPYHWASWKPSTRSQ